MIVTARLLSAGRLQRVGILDCDWHYGNGTDDIIRQLGLHSQVIHCTSGAENFHHDAERYFRWLERSLNALWNADVGLVLYQAGADAHCDDPLGGLLDDDELAERDRLVFDFCHAKRLPIAWCLAGGYQRDEEGSIEPVLRIHRHTMMQAGMRQSKPVEMLSCQVGRFCHLPKYWGFQLLGFLRHLSRRAQKPIINLFFQVYRYPKRLSVSSNLLEG